MPNADLVPESADSLALTSAAALVLGGDLGGTSTRILIADPEGTVVGRGAAGGGNPTSHPASAAAALGQALRQALAGLDPGHVGAAVIGAAGGSALSKPEVRAQFDAAWSETGLHCRADYINDLEIAFASGTAEPDGTVLIAGTGSAAGAVVDHRLTRTADGHGWLLGDDGSGFWLGREAVRRVLRALDLGEPTGALGAAVVAALLPGATCSGRPESSRFDRLRDDLVRAANSQPPVMLAALARAVVSAYDAGDESARSIVKRAAELLTDTISRIRSTDDTRPLVLAGSVAGEESPVGQALRETIQDWFAGEVLTAQDGVGGATWLALGVLDPTRATHKTHARLTTTPG